MGQALRAVITRYQLNLRGVAFSCCFFEAALRRIRLDTGVL
jgi:hypothetical protein